MNKKESAHIERIKNLDCGVCGQSGPSDAHHMLAGRTPGRKSPHFLVMPLCKDCHQGSSNGIHGKRRMWSVMKKTEHEVLAESLERLYG